MCFKTKTPKAPKPPPLPKPVDPMKAAVEGEEDIIRRQKAALAPRASTVVTSATGDPGYGLNVGATRLVA